MQGRIKIPSTLDLVRASNSLQTKEISEAPVLNALEAVRFDPRLAEILTQRLLLSWKVLNPDRLNDGLLNLAWPSSMGPLLESCEASIPRTEINEFRRWKRRVMMDVKKARSELFWIGLFAFAGKRMRQEAESATRPFLRWGYLANASLLNRKEKAPPAHKTVLPKAARESILRRLAESTTRFVLEDYLRALNHQVTKRVAELDLKNATYLEKSGNTRARTYRLAKRSSPRSAS